MNRVKFLLMSALAVLAFNGIGCDGYKSSVQNNSMDNTGEKPKQNDNSPAQTLKGTAWKLENAGGNFFTKLPGKPLEPQDCENCYTLIFETDTSFRGHSHANDFWGEYQADSVNGTIQLYKISMTKALSNPDGEFFENHIGAFVLFIREDNRLRLFYRDEERENNLRTFLFRPKA